MILITGGAAQGKRALAEKLGITLFTDGASAAYDEILAAECVTNAHLLVRRLTDDGADLAGFAQRLCTSAKVVIINEIGCGIVPIEKEERTWRENVGCFGCALAAAAETVVRVTCGIPAVIKGEMP